MCIAGTILTAYYHSISLQSCFFHFIISKSKQGTEHQPRKHSLLYSSYRFVYLVLDSTGVEKSPHTDMLTNQSNAFYDFFMNEFIKTA